MIKLARGNIVGVLKNRDFFALWMGQTISEFGDRLAQMGLVGLYLRMTAAFSVSQSVPLMRDIIFFSTLPVLIFMPLAGVCVDRFPRRYVLIATDLIRAGLVLLIPLIIIPSENLHSLYGVVFLVFTVTCFFTPAKSALIPNLVREGQLLSANSLSNVTRMLALIGGVVAGGIIVARIGIKYSFYLDSFSFLASAVAISTIRVKESVFQHEHFSVLGKLRRDLMEGFKFIIGKKEVRFLVSSLFVLMGASGMGYVLLTVMVTKSLGLGTPGLGILASVLGVGMIVGSLIYGEWGIHLKKDKVILVGGLIAGVCALILGGSDSFFWLSLGVGIIGLVGAAILIAAYTLVQEITPDRMRGRVLAAGDLIVTGSFVFFGWLAGELGKHFLFKNIFWGIGLVLAFYSGGVLMLRFFEKEA